jgi:hypothetical protein
MTQLRPAFAILLPLFGSMAHAGPQSVPCRAARIFLLGDPIS